jgi:hypothetical protein
MKKRILAFVFAVGLSANAFALIQASWGDCNGRQVAYFADGTSKETIARYIEASYKANCGQSVLVKFD